MSSYFRLSLGDSFLYMCRYRRVLLKWRFLGEREGEEWGEERKKEGEGEGGGGLAVVESIMFVIAEWRRTVQVHSTREKLCNPLLSLSPCLPTLTYVPQR